MIYILALVLIFMVLLVVGAMVVEMMFAKAEGRKVNFIRMFKED